MKERPSNIVAELLTQHLPPEEISQTLPVLIKGVLEQTSKSNRKYHVVEFYDQNGQLKKVTVWDKKLLADLTPGAKIDLTLTRNDRGFWNLTAATPLLSTMEPPAASVENGPAETTVSKVPLPPPLFRPQDLDPREYRITSMNALTNAVNFVTAFKDLLKPVNVDEAFALVDYYRSLMIELHDPNPNATTSNAPESTH